MVVGDYDFAPAIFEVFHLFGVGYAAVYGDYELGEIVFEYLVDGCDGDAVAAFAFGNVHLHVYAEIF